MERWNSQKGDFAENPDIDSFIEEILDVCKKRGLSISHEDHYGAFCIEEFKESNVKWLMAAHDETEGETAA